MRPGRTISGRDNRLQVKSECGEMAPILISLRRSVLTMFYIAIPQSTELSFLLPAKLYLDVPAGT